MKKIKNVFITTVVLLLCVCVYYGCANNENTKIATNDLISFSTLSSANILSERESMNLSNYNNTSSLMNLSNSSSTIDMDKINMYLQMCIWYMIFNL